MLNYNNGKIYKLWSPHTKWIYIGSTVQDLNKRYNKHKSDYIHWRLCSSKYLFDEYDDIEIKLIEKFPCNNEAELVARERYHYLKNKEICINEREPGRNTKEYYMDNKDIINSRQKIYNINNKDKIKEQKSKKITCDCGRTFRIHEKSRHLKSKIHQTTLELKSNNPQL